MKNDKKEERIIPIWLLVAFLVIVVGVCVLVFSLTQRNREKASAEASPTPTPPITTKDEYGHDIPIDKNGDPLPFPPSDTADITQEPLPDRVNAPCYLNNKVLSYTYGPNGETLYAGIDLGADAAQSALYLNITTTDGQNGVNMGYYLYSTPCNVMAQYGEWGEQDGETDCMLLRTYDNRKPSTYKNEIECGAYWQDNRVGLEDTITGDADIYIRAIRLGPRKLDAICKLHVAYDKATDTYQMTSLEGTDVRETGYLTEEERTELLEWCYAYSKSKAMLGAGVTDNLTEENKAQAFADSKVEYVKDRTYYPDGKVYGYTGVGKKSWEFVQANPDLVAVSLDCATSGFVTYYFSPQAEGLASVYGGSSDPSVDPALFEPVTSKGLLYAGYDIITPANENRQTIEYFS